MKQYHIEYYKLDSGAIRLKQDTYGGDDVVDLHPLQLRAIAEYFGIVAPQPPADELSKRLAEQLCAAYLALLDEQRYWSPGLEQIWERLDAQVDCLPSELFPHHLWEQREEAERKAEKGRETLAASPVGYDKDVRNAESPEIVRCDVGALQIGLGI